MGEPGSAGQQPGADEAEVVGVDAEKDGGTGQPVPGGTQAAPPKPPATSKPDIKYQG